MYARTKENMKTETKTIDQVKYENAIGILTKQK